MNSPFFIGIISHKNSEKREIQKRILDQYKNPNFIFYYFIGDPNIGEDFIINDNDKIVTLKVMDNYESLPQKTKGIIKFYNENYSDKTKGILKTDDDIDLSPEHIHKMLEKNSDQNYLGLEVDIQIPYDSNYHWGKCESDYWNSKFCTVPQSKYCAGGGYYLNRETAKRVSEFYDMYDSFIFEDVATGVILNNIDIYPTNINLKENGINW